MSESRQQPPRLPVDARDVLIAADFVHRQRRIVRQELTRRRQVLPERHVHFMTAARRQRVELRRQGES